jgi:hypothetical protein
MILIANSNLSQNLIADEIDEVAFGAVQTHCKLQTFDITLSGLAAQILLLVPNHKDGPHPGPHGLGIIFPPRDRYQLEIRVVIRQVSQALGNRLWGY